jgi:hypothetical protein
MKNPTITSAIDSHGKTPVDSLGFEKGFGIIFRRSLQSVNIHTRIGFVNVPSAIDNEEINGILHLQHVGLHTETERSLL